MLELVALPLKADDLAPWPSNTRKDASAEALLERKLVTLCDSVPENADSLPDTDRWPDLLARRLKSDPRTHRVGVLHRTVGRHTRLLGDLGPAALQRFEYGVLAESGVSWLVVQAGVHDIGVSRDASVSIHLIEAFDHLVERAHAQSVRVYGVSLLPFGRSEYASFEHELARQRVNEWLRTSGRFDAIIDFDEALRDSKYPAKLAAAYDGGDHLNPNAAGHRRMVEVVDLALFSP
jgi:lysophospholipase L1-like esterase